MADRPPPRKPGSTNQPPATPTRSSSPPATASSSAEDDHAEGKPPIGSDQELEALTAPPRKPDDQEQEKTTPAARFSRVIEEMAFECIRNAVDGIAAGLGLHPEQTTRAVKRVLDEMYDEPE